MTATHTTAAHGPNRSAVRDRTRATRPHGAVPLFRPVLGGPRATPTPAGVAVRRPGAVASCTVVSAAARREALLLRVKVATIGLLALVGMGASVAEFASWAQPDPALHYVAGDPAWAHVSGD